MGIDNITLCTYTHDKCCDVHPIYFNRISKYFNDIDSIAFCNYPINNTNTIIYKDTDPFYKQIIECLSKINTKYIIYSQEDYILFDFVKIDILKKYIELMQKDTSISFIRLIKSGIANDSQRYNDDLFIIDKNENYFYSTQATIWNKNTLIDMFKFAMPNSIRDEQYNSNYLKTMNVVGLCPYITGKAIGNHYNSYEYPYIATAIVRGRWNYSEYKIELDKIFIEYKINKDIRGTL